MAFGWDRQSRERLRGCASVTVRADRPAAGVERDDGPDDVHALRRAPGVRLSERRRINDVSSFANVRLPLLSQRRQLDLRGPGDGRPRLPRHGPDVCRVCLLLRRVSFTFHRESRDVVEMMMLSKWMHLTRRPRTVRPVLRPAPRPRRAAARAAAKGRHQLRGPGMSAMWAAARRCAARRCAARPRAVLFGTLK